MSKNVKTLLIVLAVVIGLCVVSVGVLVGALGLAANKLKDNVTTDPVKAKAMAQTFINYEAPDGYSEQMGMDMLVYKFVALTAKSSSQPMIILANFQTGASSTSPEEMSKQIQKSMEQQNNQKGTNMKLVETRKVTINGTETTLTVSEGESTSSSGTLRQWITTFPGKTGTVLLMIQGSTDSWDDDVLNQFLASLSTGE